MIEPIRCYQCCNSNLCKHIAGGTRTLASPACEDFDPGLRWIPVTERLPDAPEDTVDEHGMRLFTPTGRYLAVVKKTNAVCELGYTYCNKAFWYGNSLNEVEVTHWMPLPEPPEE